MEQEKEHKEGKNRSRLRSVIGIGAVVLLAVSVTLTGIDYWNNKKRQEEYESLAEEVQQTTTEIEIELEETEETKAPYVAPVDFEKLSEINQDKRQGGGSSARLTGRYPTIYTGWF